MDMQTPDTTQRRLKILETDEIEVLYGRPRFTPEERTDYFTLSPLESEALQAFRAVKAQVTFILQLGYFNLWGSDSPKLASLAWSRYCRSYERIYPSESQRVRPHVSSGLPCEISPCRV